MDQNFKVLVNDEHEFEIRQEQVGELDLQEISQNSFHLLHNSGSFRAEIQKGNFLQKKYSVKINSNIYEVSISNALDILIKDMGMSLAAAQLFNDIKAPMPGLILDVNVEPGEEVKAGDYLLVLEAMKMENTLTAPADGKVKAVHVQKGNTVEKNQLLIEME